MAATAATASQSSIDVPGSFPSAASASATSTRDPHIAVDHLANSAAGSDSAAALEKVAEMASAYLPQSVAGALGLGPTPRGSLPIVEGGGASTKITKSGHTTTSMNAPATNVMEEGSPSSDVLAGAQKPLIPGLAEAFESVHPAQPVNIDHTPYINAKPISSENAVLESTSHPIADKSPSPQLPTYATEAAAPEVLHKELEVNPAALPSSQYQNSVVTATLASTDPNAPAPPLTQSDVLADLAPEREYANDVSVSAATPGALGGAAPSVADSKEATKSKSIAPVTGSSSDVSRQGYVPLSSDPASRNNEGTVAEKDRDSHVATVAAAAVGAGIAGAGLAGLASDKDGNGSGFKELNTPEQERIPAQSQAPAHDAPSNTASSQSAPLVAPLYDSSSVSAVPPVAPVPASNEVQSPAPDLLGAQHPGSQPARPVDESKREHDTHKDRVAAGAAALGLGGAYAAYKKKKSDDVKGGFHTASTTRAEDDTPVVIPATSTQASEPVKSVGETKPVDQGPIASDKVSKETKVDEKEMRHAQKEAEKEQKSHEKEAAAATALAAEEKKAQKEAEKEEQRKATEAKEAEREEKRKEKAAAAIAAAEAKEAKTAEKEHEKEEKRIAKEAAAAKAAEEKEEKRKVQEAKDAEKEAKRLEKDAAVAAAALAAEEEKAKKEAEKEEHRKAKEEAAAQAAREKEAKHAEKESKKEAKEHEKEEKRHEKEVATAAAVEKERQKKAFEDEQRRKAEEDQKRKHEAQLAAAGVVGAGAVAVASQNDDSEESEVAGEKHHHNKLRKDPPASVIEDHRGFAERSADGAGAEFEHPKDSKQGTGSKFKAKIASVFHRDHDKSNAKDEDAKINDEKYKPGEAAAAGAGAGALVAGADVHEAHSQDHHDASDPVDAHTGDEGNKDGLKGSIISPKEEEHGSHPLAEATTHVTHVDTAATKDASEPVSRPPPTTLAGKDEDPPRSGTDSDFPLTTIERPQAVDISGGGIAGQKNAGGAAAAPPSDPEKEDRARYSGTEGLQEKYHGGALPSNSGHYGRRSTTSSGESGGSGEGRKPGRVKQLVEKFKEKLH